MPRFDHCVSENLPSVCNPALVIFLSHRWRDVSHPDPDGRTLRAIRELLNSLLDLARGLDPQDDALVPSLTRPAMLQASVLLYRLLERCDLAGEEVLDRVAVFFDFSSLPQGQTEQDRATLATALQQFPSMIPDPLVTLLALRGHSDGYATRAWCVAESVLSLRYDDMRPWIYTFPLRMDLEPKSDTIAFEPLRDAIERWSRNVSGKPLISSKEFEDWLQIVQLCVDWHSKAREEAMAAIHHSPDSAEKSFALWIAITTRLAAGGDQEVDLAPIVREVAAAEGLECTNPKDRVLTGLLILAGLRWEELNRNSGSPSVQAPEGPDFWQMCLSHYLNGGALRAEVRNSPYAQQGVLAPPTLALVGQ